MRTGIHPPYELVIFEDASSDFRILTRSTCASSEKGSWEDGNEYPVVRVEVTSASHPFFTGKMRLVDSAGRVERFEQRYGKRRRPNPEPT